MLGRLLKHLFKAENSARAEKVDAHWIRAVLRLQQQGDYQAVVSRCRAALVRESDHVDVHNLLGAGLLAQGRTHEGVVHLRRAIAILPSAHAHTRLGEVLAVSGDFEGAIASYHAALVLDGRDTDIRNRLATLFKALARYDEAEACCREGLRECPGHAALNHTLGTVMFEQGRVEEAIAALRVSIAQQPDDPAAHSELLRMLSYSDTHTPAAIFQEHRAWAGRHADALERSSPPHRNDPAAERRLRVGFVSPYLRKHAVTFFLESIIEHHDRERMEIYLYADVARPDEYSERLERHGAHWRQTVNLDHAQLAQRVRDDAIDILVDLSGHTANNRLLAFARKPAPVQVNWLGFPSTTGMDSMDYRITDKYCDPPGMTEHLNSEKLMRLPDIYMAWRPPDDMPDVAPPPAIRNGHVTFGTFHSAFKITPTIADLWARILKRIPDSRLSVMAISGVAAERHMRALFSRHGMDPARLTLLPRLPFDDYLAAFRDVDIALDTFPYHGATTTCFSLWMGVPVVVLAGTTHASRADVSMLSNAGLPQLIAHSGDDYVGIAERLARDLPQLAQLRANLRDMVARSPAADGPACARNLECALREMWGEWCKKTRGAVETTQSLEKSSL